MNQNFNINKKENKDFVNYYISPRLSFTIFNGFFSVPQKSITLNIRKHLFIKQILDNFEIEFLDKLENDEIKEIKRPFSYTYDHITDDFTLNEITFNLPLQLSKNLKLRIYNVYICKKIKKIGVVYELRTN